MADNRVNSSSSIPDRESIEQFELATKDLLWQSEAEFPIGVVYWQNLDNLNETTLLEKCSYPSETKIAVQEFYSFFSSVTKQENWHNEEEQAEVIRYQSLADLLAEKLTDIKVYLLGEVEIDVYILGKTKYGAIAGLTTKIVRT